MGRSSQEQAQKNRQKIVECASRLFREFGVDNVSVAEVMSAADMTIGGFYKHFKSKDALVEEVFSLTFEQSSAAWRQVCERKYDDPSLQSAAIVDYYLKKKGNQYVKTAITLTEGTLVAPDFNHDSHAYNYDCDGKGYTYPKTSCVMDGTYITGIRTAASAILSARMLSRSGARIATVIGAGVQGREHVRLLPLIRDFKRINICSLRFEDAQKLAAGNEIARRPRASGHMPAVLARGGANVHGYRQLPATKQCVGGTPRSHG